MTREERDQLEFTSQCRRPEPLTCYDELMTSGDAQAARCLHCPVAGWVTVMVLRDWQMQNTSNL